MENNQSKTDQPSLSAFSIKDIQTAVTFISTVFASILGLSTLATVTGFIAVNQHLSRYTDIYTFNISPNRYIAGGAATLIGAAIVGGSIGGLVWLVSQQYLKQLPKILSTGKPLPFLMRNKWVSILAGVAYAIGFAFFFGSYFQRAIPNYLGGGQPSSIELIFKDDKTAALLGLSTVEGQPNHTKTLWMLADLVDGYLVLDGTTGQVSAVKSDLVLGILDDKKYEEAPSIIEVTVPVLAPTPSPTP